MKILQIRFKNLNSLVGEWEIDLSHPAYISDGIFAITGPTGAGKTSILDAICLALYGRTPRLNRINKSVNEIMSRQTGECFAEVTFETQAGRFRCHWSQHRARKKSGGDLQNPKHEIANADSGEIFESKLKGVADQVEIITGMDFDRFTRSMLLAQGGFAAFLQAASDERAPILEQITGTEIYSKISVRVHEFRTEERKKLDLLQAELMGMQFLSVEEEIQLTQTLGEKAQQTTALTASINEKNTAITWLENVTRLEFELKNLDLEKAELQHRLETFAAEKTRLQRANTALELAADYAALSAIRKEQGLERSALHKSRETLPCCAEVAEQADDAMSNASKQLVVGKTEQQEALPLIRRVRELDLKITEKNKLIKTTNVSIADLVSLFETLKIEHVKYSNELSAKQTAVEKLNSQLVATKVDGKLREQLEGVRGRFDYLKTVKNQFSNKRQEAVQAENKQQSESNVCLEQHEKLKKSQGELEIIKQQGDDKKAALQNILEKKDAAHWRDQQALLTAQNDLVGKTLEAIQAQSRANEENVKLDQRKVSLVVEQKQINTALRTETQNRALQETVLTHLETQLTLLKRIDDLESARHHLEDGEPCPLCGAESHPYAEGNIPKLDDTQQELSVLRAALTSLNELISACKVTLAQVGKDLEQVASAQQEQSSRVDENRQVVRQNCEKLALAPELLISASKLQETLSARQQKNGMLLARASDILKTVDLIEKELHTLRESFSSTRDMVSDCDRKAQAATHKKDSAAEQLKRLKNEANELNQQQDDFLTELKKELQVFGIETLSIEQLDVTLDQLILRRDQWVVRTHKKDEFEKIISALGVQLLHQENTLATTGNDLNKEQENVAELLREKDLFSQERCQIFGNKNADQEEARFSTNIDVSEKELEGARDKSSLAKQALNKINARLDELVKSIESRKTQLTSIDTAFVLRLKASGFIDESSYQSACLTEDERRALTGQSQQLLAEESELNSKQCDKKELLKTEREKEITSEPLEDLKKAQVILVDDQRDLQQEVGGIRSKLDDNEHLKQQQKGRVDAINSQKRECVRWDLLHKLIGSSDGKKYRNFAQGLTFEMMIRHANRQLQKMTDRYLLIRDIDQPLELNVVDNYQAGEIRSTKNLSGGESFIVSLSLALGLSQMASQNVRVDSLFLDEGFGTLDEEALDTALEALSGLQQEGKLIGVISHVPALKERISTQIQVMPNNGGRSRIAGPGCSELIVST
ncbi:MAG: AAA family ATPase [Pseudomonadales bacterium]|nr:AAA family ATPase [Pseudomonadales bacterium]